MIIEKLTELAARVEARAARAKRIHRGLLQALKRHPEVYVEIEEYLVEAVRELVSARSERRLVRELLG